MSLERDVLDEVMESLFLGTKCVQISAVSIMLHYNERRKYRRLEGMPVPDKLKTDEAMYFLEDHPWIIQRQWRSIQIAGSY